MRKILYISGTRADYGLMKETLLRIERHPGLTLEIAVTGMHLMPEFGKTIDEIKKDRFKFHIFKAVYEKDNKESMFNFIGKFSLILAEKIQNIRPDAILILGDRAEMLVAAIAGVYLNIPVAHIHGGDVTSTVDGIVRHAITKLSHIHLAATRKSAERIIRMGEEPWRVYTIGAPGLHDVLNESLSSKRDIAKKYNLDLTRPILLVIQHPVTSEVNDASRQIRETMEAVRKLGYQSIVIYPNADAGGRKMIDVIERYRRYAFIKAYKNIPRRDYLSLMNTVSVMVGNSSSGIIESPSLHLPFVNIGMRQEGRERADNIIDVDYDREEIKKAIRKAIHSRGFKEKVKKCKSPYGDGRAGKRIVNILAGIRINDRLLQKGAPY